VIDAWSEEMAETNKKPVPPYATYKSFSNFINGLREHGTPKHITRSVLPGSNSGKAAMSATLSTLGLVNAKDEPTDLMRQLTDADQNYNTVLKEVLEESYSFLHDGSLDIADTTTDKVVEKFKELGASGSTVTKCMAFFLSAAQDAKITVSRYVKTPAAPPKSKAPKKNGRQNPPDIDDEAGDEGDSDYPTDKERIVVSVHGMDEWEIFVPKGLTSAQWKHGLKMAKFILDNYRPSDDSEVQPEDLP
jgi:hypothetical protein